VADRANNDSDAKKQSDSDGFITPSIGLYGVVLSGPTQMLSLQC